VTDHFPGYNWELPLPGRTLTEGFNRALARLIDRARPYGAHGIVDISMSISGGSLHQGTVDVSLTGTAIVHPASPPLDAPFTAGVSCQAFAKLIGAGLVPVQFAMGATLLSSWIGCQSRSEIESGQARTVEQLGDALTQARDTATSLMWQQTDLAEAPFVGVSVRHAHHKASKTDFRTSAWATGTVVQRFATARTEAEDMVTAVVPMGRR
jgi:uncharacterized protein YbjQ (UPF0145 family)